MRVIVIGFIFFCAQMSYAQYIEKVESGSIYERLGIKVGDRIITYNSGRGDSFNPTKNSYMKADANDIKSIVIEREGKKLTLNYKIE